MKICSDIPQPLPVFQQQLKYLTALELRQFFQQAFPDVRREEQFAVLDLHPGYVPGDFTPVGEDQV
jgi:hypothetical protein